VAARSCSVAKIVFFATPFFVGRRVEICRAVEEANGGEKKNGNNNNNKGE
jgi:hypothetical protein